MPNGLKLLLILLLAGAVWLLLGDNPDERGGLSDDAGLLEGEDGTAPGLRGD